MSQGHQIGQHHDQGKLADQANRLWSSLPFRQGGHERPRRNADLPSARDALLHVKISRVRRYVANRGSNLLHAHRQVPLQPPLRPSRLNQERRDRPHSLLINFSRSSTLPRQFIIGRPVKTFDCERGYRSYLGQKQQKIVR